MQKNRTMVGATVGMKNTVDMGKEEEAEEEEPMYNIHKVGVELLLFPKH